MGDAGGERHKGRAVGGCASPMKIGSYKGAPPQAGTLPGPRASLSRRQPAPAVPAWGRQLRGRWRTDEEAATAHGMKRGRGSPGQCARS